MYLRYYGFEDYPFSVTPDPAFLYLGASHREALGHLLYGAGEHGGFVALIGEVGTGKTTLIRALVDNEMPDLDIALCWHPHLEAREFVATICDELGACYDPQADTSLKSLVDRLNGHLLKAHASSRRTVLIIDEAQNLSREVLEQLRLLTNLETHKHKLLRIILVGQPELDDLLARHDLRQLAQRITARFWLQPLDRAETRAYIRHRLELAGASQHLFTRPAMLFVRSFTGGIPRLINMVCERALMGGYAHARSRIGALTICRAAAETLPRSRKPRMRIALPAIILAIGAAIGGLAWYPGIELTRAAEWIHPGDVGQVAQADDGSGAAADADATDQTALLAHNEPATEEHTDDSGEAGSDSGSSGFGTGVASDSGGAVTAKAPVTSTGIPKGSADLNQLLRLWGVFGSEIRANCRSLRVGDLRCLTDRGNFAMVERYNRPALLTIQHEGRRQKVLLSSLEKDHAILVGADGTRRVTRRKLADSWTGAFEIVWRSDSGMVLIPPGTVGDAVVWLRRHLARANGKNPETELGPPSPVYDDALKAQLKRFQLAHGLDPDGMAGPRTQMMLNGAVATPGSPSLATRAQ